MHSRNRPWVTAALLGGAVVMAGGALAGCGGGSSSSSDTPYQNTGSLPRASGAYDDSIPGGPQNIEGPSVLKPIPRAALDDGRVRAARIQVAQVQVARVQVAQVRDDEPEEGDRPLPTFMMASSGDEEDDAPPTTIRQDQNQGAGSSSIGDFNAPPPGQPGSGTRK